MLRINESHLRYWSECAAVCFYGFAIELLMLSVLCRFFDVIVVGRFLGRRCCNFVDATGVIYLNFNFNKFKFLSNFVKKIEFLMFLKKFQFFITF